jgi:hypothetical protein
VFVMSLFAPTAMAHDRILQTNRAVANDPIRTNLRPIGFQLALRHGK